MKKLVAFAAVIAAVSFASCGNKSAENTEVAETETEATVEEVVAPAEQATTEETAVAEGDSTAVEAPAAETFSDDAEETPVVSDTADVNAASETVTGKEFTATYTPITFTATGATEGSAVADNSICLLYTSPSPRDS